MFNLDWAVSWFALVGITNAWSFDAVLLELVRCAMIQLRRLQHGFRRDAARVQAGTTERMFAIPVLPLVYTRDAHTVLRGPDCSYIASGSGSDNNDIKFSAHLRFSPLNL